MSNFQLRSASASLIVALLIAWICEAEGANPYEWSAPTIVEGLGETSIIVSPGRDVAIYVKLQDRAAGFLRTLDAGKTWQDLVTLDLLGPQNLCFRGVDIAVDNDERLYFVWFLEDTEQRRVMARLARTFDLGESWSMGLLSEVDPSSELSDIACDGDGNVVCLAQHRGEILFNVSHDFGSSWKPRFSPLEMISGNRFVSVVISGGNGVFYVLFHAESSAGGDDPPEGDGLYLSVSYDGGENWTESPRRIDQSEVNRSFGLIVADESGHVHVAWNNLNTNEFSGTDVYLRSSSDYGRNFTASVRINTNPRGHSYTRLYDLATDCRGGVYVVYVSWREGTGPALFFNRSLDYGLSLLSEDILISPQPVVIGGELEANNDGQIVVAWTEAGARSGSDVFASISHDRGTSWEAAAQALDVGLDDDYLLDRPTVDLNSAGQVFVKWTEGNPAACDVLVAGHSQLLLDDGMGPEVVLPEGGAVTVPLFLRNDGSATMNELDVWVDLTLPDGSTTSPILGPVRVHRLGPGRVLSSDRRVLFPAELQPGAYTVNLRVGAPVDDVASLCVIKRP